VNIRKPARAAAASAALAENDWFQRCCIGVAFSGYSIPPVCVARSFSAISSLRNGHDEFWMRVSPRRSAMLTPNSETPGESWLEDRRGDGHKNYATEQLLSVQN
jgi:hypothetical protein